MTLAEVPRSSAVFVDANILIYHFTGRSDQCSAFLTRIEAGEVIDQDVRVDEDRARARDISQRHTGPLPTPGGGL